MRFFSPAILIIPLSRRSSKKSRHRPDLLTPAQGGALDGMEGQGLRPACAVPRADYPPYPLVHAISQRVRRELYETYAWFWAGLSRGGGTAESGGRHLVAFPAASPPAGHSSGSEINPRQVVNSFGGLGGSPSRAQVLVESPLVPHERTRFTRRTSPPRREVSLTAQCRAGTTRCAGVAANAVRTVNPGIGIGAPLASVGRTGRAVGAKGGRLASHDSVQPMGQRTDRLTAKSKLASILVHVNSFPVAAILGQEVRFVPWRRLGAAELRADTRCQLVDLRRDATAGNARIHRPETRAATLLSTFVAPFRGGPELKELV
jgi:hypothetical protein